MPTGNLMHIALPPFETYERRKKRGYYGQKYLKGDAHRRKEQLDNFICF